MRKRKERLIGSVECRCLLVLLRLGTLIVDLALSFDSVAPLNDDGHRHDDNKECHGGSHQYTQQRCHLEVESVTCTERERERADQSDKRSHIPTHSFLDLSFIP